MKRAPLIGVDLRALVRRPTGIGVATRSLLEAMAPASELRFLGLAHRRPEVNGWCEAAGIRIAVRRLPSGVAWQQLVLPGQLTRNDVDLFWSPLQTAPLATSVPTVVTVHDLTVLTMPEVHRLKIRLSQLPFLGLSLRRARRIVADSESTADDVRRHFPDTADRVRVVPNGVDPSFRPAPSETVAAIRRDLGLPDGYILFAGTLEPRKNVSTLLDAWEILRDSDQATPPLVLAGGYGWKSRELMRRLERLRSHGVHWLGRLERARLVEVMQGARLFAFPSLHEGFGLPVVEAMACGVPVVASDRGSLPEVIGEAGLQVDPDDPAALAEAIDGLLADYERAGALAARGRRRAERFTWTRSAELMREVFDEVLTEVRSEARR